MINGFFLFINNEIKRDFLGDSLIQVIDFSYYNAIFLYVSW